MWRNNEIEYSGYGNIDKVAKSKFNIIYTMQPSIGNIPDSIIRLIEMFKTEVQFWIRIHPRQFNSSIRQGISEKYAQYTNVNIDEACQLPLPAIMSRMNLHITGFSSSVYEAALFDVMTVFVNKAGCEYFGDLIGEGKATYKESFEELSMFVKQRIVRQVQGDLNYL